MVYELKSTSTPCADIAQVSAVKPKHKYRINKKTCEVHGLAKKEREKKGPSDLARKKKDHE